MGRMLYMQGHHCISERTILGLRCSLLEAHLSLAQSKQLKRATLRDIFLK